MAEVQRATAADGSGGGGGLSALPAATLPLVALVGALLGPPGLGEWPAVCGGWC